MKRLVNTDISSFQKNVDDYKEAVVDGAYDYYKKIETFVNSDAMKGESGESVFGYYNEVHKFLLNKIMNVAAEIAKETEQAKQLYLSYETDNDGIVDTDVIDDTRNTIKKILKDFKQHETALNKVDAEIMHITGVKRTNSESVLNQFANSDKVMNKIIHQLGEEDENLYSKLNTLDNRVSELKSAITDIDQHFKTDGGFSDKKVDEIKDASWFTDEKTDVFDKKYEESPFETTKADDSSYTTEFGFVTDFGTNNSGVSANEYGYDYTLDGDTMSAGAHYTGLEARSDFDGEYVNAGAHAKIGYGEGNIKIDDGIVLDGKAGVGRADADTMVGWDDWNVHAEGDAGVLTADGKVRADNGGVGFGGNVSLASAGVKGGTTLAGVDIDAGVDVGKFGGGLELAWDKFEFDLHVGIGAKLSVEFPW